MLPLRYLDGLLDLFGKYDDNGDGVVEFDEFRDLWAHLGGEEPIAGAAQLEGNRGDGDVDPEFDEFDLNADGVLSARGASAQPPPPPPALPSSLHTRARAHTHTHTHTLTHTSIHLLGPPLCSHSYCHLCVCRNNGLHDGA